MAYEGEGAAARLRRLLSRTFGFRGPSNVVSWAVAGGLAYYYIYLPEQSRQAEIQAARERAKQFAIERGIQDIDRARPIADPQDTGLIKGARKAQQQPQEQQQQQPDSPQRNQ